MSLDRIDSICARVCLLDKQRPVVVGVSGGADSLALADVLHRLGYRLVVAHFDHKFRADSGADVETVRGVAGRYGAVFASAEADVPALARAARLSLEEAGRAARYGFLFETARLHNAQAVAVGHTADDQVETVLMHLLRGSGLAGLKGMRERTILPEWDGTIPLVRPLLGAWRAETEAWCAAHGLTPLQDASNADTTFFRNRLRHELIPLLETYNPRIKAVLLRTSQSLAGDLAVLEDSVAAAWQSCLVSEGTGKVTLQRGAFLALEKGLQRGVLRRAVKRLRPRLRDLDFDSIERAIAHITDPDARGSVDLVQLLSLSAAQEEIAILDWTLKPDVDLRWPQISTGAVLELPLPGMLVLENGWAFISELAEHNGDACWLDDPAHAWLDADRLELPLAVRARRPGDRFAPLGLDGHALKVSDFFINSRIERAARAGWPLVFSGQQIAWLPMLRLGHAFRITAQTRRVARLRVTRLF